MKRMKKLFAMLMALTMVLGMTMTANAAIINPDCPSANDDAEVTVSGLDAGLTVMAYQIVDADYYPEPTEGVEAEKGFKGYVVVEAVKTLLGEEEYEMTAPESEHITTIANAIEEGTITLESAPLTWDATRSVYAKDLTAGAWIILVDSAADDVEENVINIYNPMLAGVYYTNTTGEGNDIAGGSVDATSEWDLEGTEMYAKSTITKLNKDIVTPGSGNANGDDVAIGDTVTYKIETYMPKYSAAYTDLTFTLTDTLSPGLTPCAPGGVTVAADGTTITDGFTVDVTGQVLTVDFTDAGILANAGKEITVTYTAVLNENAAVDQVPNDNDVDLEYTNNPDGSTDFLESKTYHHTFEFQVEKTDEQGNVLEGAEFTLTRTDEELAEGETADEYVEVSGTDGLITFTGLDAGEYDLVETKAPTGYQIDDTVRKVVISATYNETTGEIESYTITISGNEVESWTDEAAQVTINMLSIMNTQLIALPSTGGIGTTIFTIAGCGIMIAAAFFFFASRRREYR